MPGKRPKTTHSLVQKWDQVLAEYVTISMFGQSQRVTKFEAIVWQLLQHEFGGNRKASRVLRAYQKLAGRTSTRAPRVTLIDADYTGIKPKKTED